MCLSIDLCDANKENERFFNSIVGISYYHIRGIQWRNFIYVLFEAIPLLEVKLYHTVLPFIDITVIGFHFILCFLNNFRRIRKEFQFYSIHQSLVQQPNIFPLSHQVTDFQRIFNLIIIHAAAISSHLLNSLNSRPYPRVLPQLIKFLVLDFCL